jgi:hypothetical protein
MDEIYQSDPTPIIPRQVSPQPEPGQPQPLSPKPPKKRGIFAYVGFALLGDVLYYILLAFVGSSFGNNGAYSYFYYLALLIPVLFAFILSSIFFKEETLMDRIGKSILGTLFLYAITLLIGLGFCFLLLIGSGV